MPLDSKEFDWHRAETTSAFAPTLTRRAALVSLLGAIGYGSTEMGLDIDEGKREQVIQNARNANRGTLTLDIVERNRINLLEAGPVKLPSGEFFSVVPDDDHGHLFERKGNRYAVDVFDKSPVEQGSKVVERPAAFLNGIWISDQEAIVKACGVSGAVTRTKLMELIGSLSGTDKIPHTVTFNPKWEKPDSQRSAHILFSRV